MKQFWIIAMGCLMFETLSMGRATNLSFPENLKIGVSSAAYQIEGAWNVSGKGESIWDRWTHDNPDAIADGSNGDVAANAYYKYKEDVQLIKSMGLDFYRFSISWPRVLPTGRSNVINDDGLQYYKNLTAELVANGIEPVVTMYHWDHPHYLEEFGGWTNELMAEWFVSYARILFKALGDSVKIWTTVNEPNIFCSGGYEGLKPLGRVAPGKKLNDTGRYLCVHNMLKAHALTYRMYDKEFRKTQQGEVGIVSHCTAFVPLESSDIVFVETAFQFDCGWIHHPIQIGDYPEIMKERIAMISEAQGYEASCLPKFSDEWISLIKGTADFFGLNHYSTMLVSSDPDGVPGMYNYDSGIVQSINSSWSKQFIPELSVNPSGFRDILRWIKNAYGNPRVRVMESGYSDDGDLEDYDRVSYHHDYLMTLLRAVHEDGCNVISYSTWSLFDDFEWGGGYAPKFGVISVDFNNPDRPRTPRLSASWWTSVLKNRELQPIPTRCENLT